MQMTLLQPARRLVVLNARGLTVTVIYDEIECIVGRLETQIEHTLWSFMGCGRERRIPVVRLNTWTTHGGPFTTTIEVDDEEEGSRVLESLMAQIPEGLNGDVESEEEEDAERDEAQVKDVADNQVEMEEEESEDEEEERPDVGSNPTH